MTVEAGATGATTDAGAANDASERRRILAVLSAAGFASTFAMRFLDPMVGIISRDLAADPHTIALLASAFALPYAFIQPILGPVGDSLGKQKIMTVCLACLSASLVVSALAPTPAILFAARIVSGASGGGIIPLALATIGDRVPIAERQVAISRFLIFSISGQLTGGTVSGVLAGFLGWRGVVGCAAFVALAAFIGLVLGMRGRHATGGVFTLGVALERYRRILAMGRARALFSFVFVEGIVIFGIMPFVAPLLEGRGAGSAFEAGLISACFALGGVAYTLSVPWLLRLLGVRRMLVGGGIIIGCAFAAFSGAPPWQGQAALFLAAGYGFYVLHNSYQVQVTELVSDARASAVSLHAFSFFCGQAIGPLVIGASLEGLGFSRTVDLCGLGAVLLGAVSSSLLFGRQRAL